MYNTLIDVHTLRERHTDSGWVIADCQYDLADKQAGYQSWLQGHIPGAVYFHLHDDLSAARPVTDSGRHPLPSPEDLEEKFSAKGIDNHKQVVAYDSSGGAFAARLWWLLRYAGHTRAAVLDGGLEAWRKAGFELEAGETEAVAGDFRASPERDRLVRLPEVLDAPRLVDARDAARYRGDTEPIERVGGHIPGARNHCWKNNLDEHGKFLSPERLRQLFGEIYADVPAQDVTFYCGSGVTACHNALAAVQAGYPLPRLYVGSWSEWSADPARPVATGPEPGG